MLHGVEDFSKWQVIDIPSTGATEKLWLKSNNNRGIFKFSDTKNKDYWVEPLAGEIFKLVGLETMKSQVGNYKGKMGTMCYDFTLYKGSFTEMDDELVQFADSRRRGRYTVSMLKQVVSKNTFRNIVKMLIIDYIIGNFDRHTKNFGILSNRELAPIYDSGSSLSYRLKSTDIPHLIRDKDRLYNSIHNVHKSRCEIEGTKEVYTNKMLMKHLKETETELFNRCKEEVIEELTNEKIELIVNKYILLIDDDKRGYLINAITERTNYLKGEMR